MLLIIESMHLINLHFWTYQFCCFDMNLSIVPYLLFLLIFASFPRNNMCRKTQFCKRHFYEPIFRRWNSIQHELYDLDVKLDFSSFTISSMLGVKDPGGLHS